MKIISKTGLLILLSLFICVTTYGCGKKAESEVAESSKESAATTSVSLTEKDGNIVARTESSTEIIESDSITDDQATNVSQWSSIDVDIGKITVDEFIVYAGARTAPARGLNRALPDYEPHSCRSKTASE